MLNTDRGLKAFEGFMGHNIKESNVPFEIDRKLTKAEIQDVVDYCRNDVKETIEIFLQRIDEFNTMMYFIKHFNLPISSISKTKAQLAAEILGGNHKGETFDIQVDLKKELIELFLNVGTPLTYDEIYAKFPNIEKEQINSVL